jgi:hypothetical protein
VSQTQRRPGMDILEVLAAWKSILTGSAPMMSIEVTRECPLSCPGCYAYGELRSRRLSQLSKPERIEHIARTSMAVGSAMGTFEKATAHMTVGKRAVQG